MRLAAIVALSKNRVIGKDNKLPWHLPADLRYFKQVTLNKTIVMGRKTYESIGRPLPLRNNIVITRDPHFDAPGCLVFNSIEEVLAAIAAEDEVMVIGGAHLYQQLLPRMDRLYLTLIHEDIEGDVFFPELNQEEWIEVSRVDHDADEKNPHRFSFVVKDRLASREESK